MKSAKLLSAALVAALALSGCAKLGIGGGDGKKKSRTPVLGQRIPVLSAETGADVDPALADVAVLLPPAVVNDSWAQPGGNAPKVLEHLALGTALGKVWDAKIDGTNNYQRLASAPIIAEGKLFVTDIFAQLTAYDASSGQKLWSAQVGSKEDARGGISPWSGNMTRNRGILFGGGVSYENGTLFATNGLGDVVAMKASDGSQIWKVRPSGPLRGAPGVSNGQLYVMTSDNQLFALNQTDGSVVWTTSAAAELAGIFGAAAPSMAQGTVVVGFSSGELNAYRYENGRPLWGDVLSKTSISTSVSSLSDIDANPVIDRGRVFAVGQGGRMISMDLVTGQRIWELNIAGISTPWIAGEWVFVVDDKARLYCIARSSGKVRWISQLRGWRKEKKEKKKDLISWVGPVIAGDRLILANSRGELVNVSPADGKVQSTTRLSDGVTLPLVVANNTLYVLDDGGRITAWR